MNGDDTKKTDTEATTTPDTTAVQTPDPQTGSAEAETPRAEAGAAETEAPKPDPQTGTTEADGAKADAQAGPAGGIADALRQAFTDYLDTSGAREQYGDEVNIDLDFLKDHAGPMFSSMFQQLTASIIPKDLKVGVPVNPATGHAGEKPVSVNFDLGGILTSFFKPKGAATPPKTPTAADAPAAKPHASESPAAEAPAAKPDAE